MSVLSRINKDYYGGALMILIGLAAVFAGLSYDTGTLRDMGAGFFPVATGALLAGVGLLIAVFSRRQSTPDQRSDERAALPDVRGSACIVVGVLAFILFGRYCGLLPATFALVFISALGDRLNSMIQAALLALAMCVIAAGVFWWALKLQLPLLTWGG